MNSQELKDWIMSLTQDIEFIYNGKHGCINPFGVHDISLCIDNEAKNYTDIDELMNDKRFDGKSLSEVSTELLFEV